MRDAPAGLLPQLGAGGLVVDTRVVGVGKLVQHPALALRLHLLGQVTSVFHAATLGRQDQLGTKSLHGLGALDGQVLRHDQNHAVPLDRRRHRQRNAGVARGGLDQRVARLDVTALFRAFDHGERRPVFHRARRVVAFQLAQNHVAARGVVLGPDALQGDERSLSDRIFNGWVIHSLHCAIIPRCTQCPARVVKLVDAGDSKSPTERCAGSIPAPGTSWYCHNVPQHLKNPPSPWRGGFFFVPRTFTPYDGPLPLPVREPMNTPNPIDLEFASLAERDRQYNARASVADFDACMRDYVQSSALARQQCVGMYDLRYGMGVAERLDLYLPAGAHHPAPLLIFIHGGYWRALRKEDSAMMAKVFTDAGVAVATLEYPLLPEATLPETVREVRSAVAWLHRHGAAYGIDPDRMYASGSSAGGHLVGMVLASGWQASYGLPPVVIQGGVGLSGLYDIQPLCGTHINEWLRLTPEQARRLSPLYHLPDTPTPLVLAVGGLETDGFKNQTLAYETAWRAQNYPVARVDTPHCNHFNLVSELALPDSPLTQATLKMIQG